MSGWSPVTRRSCVTPRRVISQLVEQSPDGIFVVDLSGNVQDVNAAGCALLGYDRAELLTMNIAALIDPADLAAIPLRLAALNQDRAVFAVRHLLAKTGRTVIAEINTCRVGTNQIIGIVRDVTQRYEMEASLHASEAQLRVLLTAMSDVILVLDSQGTYREVAPTNSTALVAPPERADQQNAGPSPAPRKAADCLKVIRHALQDPAIC